jgi:AcrR family transcriptional regulator
LADHLPGELPPREGKVLGRNDAAVMRTQNLPEESSGAAVDTAELAVAIDDAERNRELIETGDEAFLRRAPVTVGLGHGRTSSKIARVLSDRELVALCDLWWVPGIFTTILTDVDRKVCVSDKVADRSVSNRMTTRPVAQTRSDPGTSSYTAGPMLRRPSSAREGRERILETAYDLFIRYGIHAVGIDRIVADAGVAKATLYRHFRSKEELVLAVLERREELWSREWLQRECERRGRTPATKLLAVFDALDDWFRRKDFEGCLFIATLLETHDRTSLVGAASVRALTDIRRFIQGLAEEAGVRNSDAFARQWQMLMMGSIVAAANGDVDAARRARNVGSVLLDQARRK